MSVTILERPDSADNRQNQLTAAAIPLEDRISQGPEKKTLYPPQKRTDEETEAKPHKVTCHVAREHTHQKLKMRTSESSILRVPDVTWTLILLVVVSLIWIGAVFLQGDSVGEERSIASRQLQPYRFLPARRYASAGYSDRNVSVRMSVCLSVRHAPVLCQNEES